jgi:N-acetyl-alpha-D-glucosaminyl L-malate synthase BshA
VSEFLRDETIAEFDIENPIEVIHNFVDTDEFAPGNSSQIRERLAPNGEYLLMHVSNFRKVKNIPTIVRVFSEVRKHVDARLVLIGDGPERPSVEALAVELGVNDHVVFLGDQECVAQILPAADVFLLPSEHESFGLAALEAMSCAVPVVGSRIGGLPEVIIDKETGFLCEPHDVSCMSAIILDLFSDPGKRTAVGANARARAISNFGRDRIVDQYLSAYRRLVEGKV